MGEVGLMRLRGRRSLAIQRNALEAALKIATDRADACRRTAAAWAERYPGDAVGIAADRAARLEAEHIADRIKGLIEAAARGEG